MEAAGPWINKEKLFTRAEGGYALYRIPALLTSQTGAVLAFCEGRRYTGEDADQIDILLRRSLDGGASFEPARCLLSAEGWACSNPAPVLDRATGVIWLLFCKNRQEDTEEMICRGTGLRTVWVTSSADSGNTWTEAREISASVKPADWGWYATGPGHGIQLKSGRMLIACDHSLLRQPGSPEAAYFSHVIYSDDHGQTWTLGGSAAQGTNESTAVETSDGQVYLNCRNAPGAPLQAADWSSPYPRVQAWSADGGSHFAAAQLAYDLPEPICQASLCSLTAEQQPGRNRLLFSNPASATRDHLSIHISCDEGQTWPAARLLHARAAAYSDLCALPDQTIGCLYECGWDTPYETLTFARFNQAWLEDSPKDSP